MTTRYDQRRWQGNLDADSDPEFTSGAFVYEKKGKTPLSKPRHRRGAPPKSKERRHEFKPNPLLEFFGNELDLHSASEDDEKDVLEESDHDSDRHTTPSEEPVVSKTLMTFATHPHIMTTVDDSETEPESDVGLAKRKSPLPPQVSTPSKRVRIQEVEDDSETESESDAGPVQALLVDDSETESEDEVDLMAKPEYLPRPTFPLGPGQVHLGPLVLDHAKHIMVPASINTYLREYQRDGVHFFWDLYDQHRGGLLGDDMGLVRKTIQVISFLSAIMKKYGDTRDVDRRRSYVSRLQDSSEWIEKRTLPSANSIWPTCLIIAPSSVVQNWEREFQTWGYFEVGLYIGPLTQREEVLTNFKMGRLDVVITTFDLARRDIALLDDLAWSTIIVDEVHRVKNPRSKITEAYNQFTCMRRFGLTGTAIQNSYNELWTILDWTNPGKLGTSKQWKGYVVKPLTIGQSTRATEEERSRALAVAIIVKDKLLPCFFKRRTKDIIKHQLPTKTDEVVFCPLTPTQVAVYKRILAMPSVENLIHKDELCACRSRKKRKDCCHPFDKGDVLKHMSILIKVSNHLGLILPAPSDSAEQTVRHRELAEYVFAGHPVPKYGTAILQPQYCGKWAVLDMLLRDWRKGRSNKVLLFTKSVKLLEMLEFHLGKNYYGFLKLDGSTKQLDRMPLIDRFHQDPDIFVFLISTLAGGIGLNLTGANKVVIFDPNWNPAHDLQAMDRAYRFGQTRDVSVYRLLGSGSIEELIYARQLYKQQQMAIAYQASVQTRYFAGVQGDTSRQGELFGIKNIFRLHEDTLATKMAIERASIIELDWALGHLQGKSGRRKSKPEDWVHEADLKGGKEEADLRGLSVLLFDDEPPDVIEDNDIQKTLSAIGVKYSHRNDDILQPSRIEEERSRDALRKHKQKKASTRKRKAAGADQGRPRIPDEEWPPKRKHHKAPVSRHKQLVSRQRALIDLGMIRSPAHLPVFAQAFGRKSNEEQEELIARLDEHARRSY